MCRALRNRFKQFLLLVALFLLALFPNPDQTRRRASDARARRANDFSQGLVASARSQDSSLLPAPVTLQRNHNVSLGAFFVYFRNARSALNALRTYRAAYPAPSHLYMACDAGCLDLRKAADHFGAVHDGIAHLITPKTKPGTYYSRATANTFLRVLREALKGMHDPFFIILEDDVEVLQRVTSPLLFDVNGAVFDKWIIGGPLLFASKRRKSSAAADEVTEIPLSGFGGCIFRTAFFRALLSDAATLNEDLDDLYSAAAVGKPPFDALGTDYLLASLTIARGGSVGNYDGFCDLTEDSAPSCKKRRARGELEVVHGAKDLYGWEQDAAMSPADRAVLGLDWHVNLYPELSLTAPSDEPA